MSGEFPQRVMVGPFWMCPKGHHHKTVAAAERCADDRPRKRAEERAVRSRERRVKALALRREGLTIKEVGSRLGGICPENARQIIRRAEREERYERYKAEMKAEE